MVDNLWPSGLQTLALNREEGTHYPKSLGHYYKTNFIITMQSPIRISRETERASPKQAHTVTYRGLSPCPELCLCLQRTAQKLWALNTGKWLLIKLILLGQYLVSLFVSALPGFLMQNSWTSTWYTSRPLHPVNQLLPVGHDGGGWHNSSCAVLCFRNVISKW